MPLRNFLQIVAGRVSRSFVKISAVLIRQKGMPVSLILLSSVFATWPAMAQTYSVLHSFNGANGNVPISGLTRDASGNLFGTTFSGGAFGKGVSTLAVGAPLAMLYSTRIHAATSFAPPAAQEIAAEPMLINSMLNDGLSNSAQEAEFITFDVPGSACEARFPACTTSVAINPAGTVTGFYADTNAALHGFLRKSDGTFTSFDGPGAVCTFFFSVCTQPADINPQGAITGGFCDANTCHGFLRAPDGTITAFDPENSLFTQANGINSAGGIVGSFFDANFVGHGFLRASDGTFTTFDAPDAINGTVPLRINAAGVIVGTFFDANFSQHGFLRAPDGTITTFDPAGAIFTQVTAINPADIVVGFFQDANFVTHGFQRAPDGTVSTFDVPDSTLTAIASINPAGTIAGGFSAAHTLHGFVREKDGTVTTFDPPGSTVTFVAASNPAGVIAGTYIDALFLEHGFLRISTKGH